MPEIRVTCPECSATLRLAEAVPPGKRVRCPKCGDLFRPRDAEPDDEPVSPARRRSAAEDDEPQPRRKKKRRPQKTSAVPIVLAAVAAVIVIGGGVTAAVFLWPEKKADPPVVAQGPNGPGRLPPGGGRPAPTNGAVGLNVGDTAMEIEAEDIDGNSFRLSDYRGKVVVLDFWGHW